MDKAFESQINPLYNNYSKQVDGLITKDQTNDLELYLEESTPLQYSAENEHAFIKQQTIPFPEMLSTFLRQPALDCKLGSSPSINHVWLSTRNSLFLWNISNKDADLYRYDCSEPIENVDIVNLPTHKELLVSTRNNIYLHAINDLDPKKIKLISKSATRSFGAVMSDIITSNTGRVFMKGDDGHLYELLLTLDTNDIVTYCSLACRTVNRLLYYLPSIFKSRPTEAVRSFVLDDEAKFLYILLSDSSICAVNVSGDQYLPYHRYTGKDLESIHLVSSGKTQSKLMAVSKNGDRQFFVFEEPAITFQYTRPAPPISGSLLFNKLSKESVNLSFYSQGVVGNVLEKSERTYLVFTSADLINKDNTTLLVEDVYHEQEQQKIWAIFESESSNKKFKSALKSLKEINQPISVITASGITQYLKQRPVEYLEEALLSPSAIVNIIQRYGSLETTFLAYLLACTSQQPQGASDFIRRSVTKEQSLLLYLSRVMNNVWNMDVKQTAIPSDELIITRTDLKVLLNTIINSQVLVKEEIMDLINRSIEGISFLCFMRELDWTHITQTLNTTYPGEFTFSDLVTTNRGSVLAQDIAFITIQNSKLSNYTNHYSRIGNFLYDNCLSLFGNETAVYIKAVECLHTAEHLKNDKKNALNISLQHFLTIMPYIDLERIASISQKYCDLSDFDDAVALAFAKHVSGGASLSDIHPVLFAAIEQALKHKDGRQVVVNALKLGNEDEYHFSIYQWLLEHQQKDLMITLETATLVPFIKTQMKDQAESLSCLENYYTYRHQYSSSILCLYQLATEVVGVPLSRRVECLRQAVAYLPKASDLDKQVASTVERSSTVASIQLQMYEALASSEAAAEQLNQVLFSEDELLERFAYTHSLYEEALLLLDLMDIYNWNYVKEAWTHILKNCSDESAAQQKVKKLAKLLYPSIASFPVYNIYQLLHGQFNKETAGSILVDAGVPLEVVSDAEKTVN